MKEVNILKEYRKQLSESEIEYLEETPDLHFYIENDRYYASMDMHKHEELGTIENVLQFIYVNAQPQS